MYGKLRKILLFLYIDFESEIHYNFYNIQIYYE